jgi:hypothetical protein
MEQSSMNADGRVTFSEIWKPYMEAHSLPSTRALHYLATAWGVGMALAGFITMDLSFILAAIIGGYALASSGHYFFEKRKNHGPWKPLVYPHTVLAARCTFYMFYLASTLRLTAEIQRLDIGQVCDPPTQDAIRG